MKRERELGCFVGKNIHPDNPILRGCNLSRDFQRKEVFPILPEDIPNNWQIFQIDKDLLDRAFNIVVRKKRLIPETNFISESGYDPEDPDNKYKLAVLISKEQYEYIKKFMGKLPIKYNECAKLKYLINNRLIDVEQAIIQIIKGYAERTDLYVRSVCIQLLGELNVRHNSILEFLKKAYSKERIKHEQIDNIEVKKRHLNLLLLIMKVIIDVYLTEPTYQNVKEFIDKIYQSEPMYTGIGELIHDLIKISKNPNAQLLLDEYFWELEKFLGGKKLIRPQRDIEPAKVEIERLFKPAEPEKEQDIEEFFREIDEELEKYGKKEESIIPKEVEKPKKERRELRYSGLGHAMKKLREAREKKE